MPESDLALLKRAAQEAGRIASRYFDGAPEVWEKPGGAGPVTEADLAVDAMLHEELRSARPAFGWLSEETEDDAERLATEAQFIVDPIDGTRAFIERGRDWAHALAVVEGGEITAAVVHLPLRELTYAAALGQGATLNGVPIRATGAALSGTATILANRASVEAVHWEGGTVPEFDRHFRSSLAYRLSLVAEGRFDAMLTLRPTWEWDVAAGSLIVAEAGGRTTDRTGRQLVFNNAHPRLDGVVSAGPALHAALLDRLA